MDNKSVLKVIQAALNQFRMELDERSPNLERIKTMTKDIRELMDKQLDLKENGDPPPPK